MPISAGGHLRRITGRDRAFYMKRWLQFPESFGGSISSWPFVFVESDFAMLLFAFRIQLFDADAEGHSFVFKLVRVQGRGCPVVRTQSELVLLFARDFILPRNVLSCQAHVQVKVGIVFD